MKIKTIETLQKIGIGIGVGIIVLLVILTIATIIGWI